MPISVDELNKAIPSDPDMFDEEAQRMLEEALEDEDSEEWVWIKTDGTVL